LGWGGEGGQRDAGFDTQVHKKTPWSHSLSDAVVLSTPKARMVHQVNVPQYFVREVCVRRESIDVVTKGTQGTQQGRASSTVAF
jgi:hypothetical protein